MDELNYGAKLKCGCLVAVISGDNQPNSIASETSKWIRAGLSIERITDDYVRGHFGEVCPECDDAPENTGQLTLGL
jgi:hypothetical protein